MSLLNTAQVVHAVFLDINLSQICGMLRRSLG